MELVHTCKKLTAIYHEDGFAFGGPHKVELEISRSTVIKIIIEQCYTRTITIIATDEVPVYINTGWNNVLVHGTDGITNHEVQLRAVPRRKMPDYTLSV